MVSPVFGHEQFKETWLGSRSFYCTVFPGNIHQVSVKHPESRMQLSALGTLDLGFKKPIKKHDKEVVGPRGAKCFILGLSLGVGWIRKGQVVTQEKEASSFTLLPREFTH